MNLKFDLGVGNFGLSVGGPWARRGSKMRRAVYSKGEGVLHQGKLA